MLELIKLETKQPLPLSVDGTEYRLEFPLPAIVALEKKLGRSMKTASDWFRIQTHELPDVLRAGLQQRHADEADAVVEAIGRALDPENIEVLIAGLCGATWPKATERIQAALEKARARAEKGLSPLPNVPSVAAR